MKLKLKEVKSDGQVTEMTFTDEYGETIKFRVYEPNIEWDYSMRINLLRMNTTVEII